MFRARHKFATWVQHLHKAASQQPTTATWTQSLCNSVAKAPLPEPQPRSRIAFLITQPRSGNLVAPRPIAYTLRSITQLSYCVPHPNSWNATLQSKNHDEVIQAGPSRFTWHGSYLTPAEGRYIPAAATTPTTGSCAPSVTTSLQLRKFSSVPQPSDGGATSGPKVVSKEEPAQGKLVLYRGRWIKPLRLLVRLKVLQLTGVVVLALPIVQYTQQGHVSLGTYAAVGLVVSGAAIASAALWFYSRRYVGELSLLLPDKRVVRLSTLDFWGRREENDVDVHRLVPPLKGLGPAELREVAQHAFVPLEVDRDRQYILSLRHGHLLQKDALLHLLRHGRPPP